MNCALGDIVHGVPDKKMTLTELPHEILRLIGSFLDIDSRIHFNRCLLHIDDRYSRPLRDLCFAHSYFVWHREIDKRLKQVGFQDTLTQAKVVLRLMSFLAQTRDPFFEMQVSKFVRTVVEKARQIIVDVTRLHRQLSTRIRQKLTIVCNDIIARQNPYIKEAKNDDQCKVRQILRKLNLGPFKDTRTYQNVYFNQLSQREPK